MPYFYVTALWSFLLDFCNTCKAFMELSKLKRALRCGRKHLNAFFAGSQIIVPWLNSINVHPSTPQTGYCITAQDVMRNIDPFGVENVQMLFRLLLFQKAYQHWFMSSRGKSLISEWTRGHGFGLMINSDDKLIIGYTGWPFDWTPSFCYRFHFMTHQDDYDLYQKASSNMNLSINFSGGLQNSGSFTNQVLWNL